MSSNIEGSARRMLPRWRSFDQALACGELGDTHGISTAVSFSTDFIDRLRNEWLKNRSLPYAADLLGAAFVLGRNDLATDAAEFILSMVDDANAPLRQLAEAVITPSLLLRSVKVVGTGSLGAKRCAIRLLKRRRIDEPRNAFVWTDLSLLYAALGRKEKAFGAMKVAAILAPNNRHVVRCRVRLNTHYGQPDQALDILHQTPVLLHDPWVLAAEVAVSTILDKRSRFLKQAIQMISGGKFSSFHSSELGGAVASVELAEGNVRKAKALFRDSLKRPTDNTLAQAVWSSRELDLDVSRVKQDLVPCPFEPMALAKWQLGEWEESRRWATEWRRDEPFSIRPLVHDSFVRSTGLEDYTGSEQVCREALTLNPADATVLNNLAFALANLGRFMEARATLDRVNTDNCTRESLICLVATAGLTEFRGGNAQEGQRLYRTAISTATRYGLKPLKARALLYLCREETLAGMPSSIETYAEAKRATEGLDSSDICTLSKRLDELRHGSPARGDAR